LEVELTTAPKKKLTVKNGYKKKTQKENRKE
jgi:hypothetical protein